MKRNLRFSDLLAAAIVAGGVVFGFFRLKYGFSFSDEGFFLSTPMRYCLGDVPFRDEALDSLKGFHVMMSALLCRLPADGTVILLRQIAFAFHCLCVGAMLFMFRRFFGPLLMALLFGACVFANIFNYWTPTYHTLAFEFICAGIALFAMGIGAGARPRESRDESVGATARTIRPAVWGVGAGAAFSMAWASEIPLISLLAVPVFVAVAAGGRSASLRCFAGPAVGDSASEESVLRAAVICSVAMLVTSAALFALVIFALGARGAFPDIRAALELLGTVKEYNLSVTARFGGVVRSIGLALPWAAFNAVCLLLAWAGIRKWGAGRGKWLYVLFVFLVFAVYLGWPFHLFVKHNDIFFMSDWLEGLCLVSMVVAPVALVRARAAWRGFEWVLCVAVFSTGVALHFVLAASAASGLLVGTVMSLPFLLLSLVMCAGKMLSPAGGPETGRGFAVALCACVCAAVVACNLFSFSDETWVWKYGGQFENARLRGIIYRADDARATDALVDYLGPRLIPGETLLAFYDIPMLHFLTGTRAALPTAVPNGNWPDSTRERFIDIMIQRKRVPRYAVLYGPPDNDPVFDFVRNNYLPDARIGPYFVWKLKRK